MPIAGFPVVFEAHAIALEHDHSSDVGSLDNEPEISVADIARKLDISTLKFYR